MKVEPYLFFNGKCEEAIEFYKQAAGAKVQAIMRFKDNPQACGEGKMPAHMLEKVMHAGFQIGETLVMASDGECTGKTNFEGFSLSIAVQNDAEAEKLFAALSSGGMVIAPMGETFFASRFGMAKDKFGVGWMVINSRNC